MKKINKKIIAIIPARGGSKGIQKKNIKLLAGKPLISYSIQQSLKSKYIQEVIVSTDDEEISSVSKNYGAEVIIRPKKLGGDEIPTEPVIEHSLIHFRKKHGYLPNYFVLLQPTSPLRESKDIDDAIKKIIDENADSLFSACKNDRFYWDAEQHVSINYDFTNRPRRQDKIWELIENGSIYITKADMFLKEKNRLTGKIISYLMPKWKSFEIDEPFDFELVEFLMNKKLKKKKFDHKIKNIKMVIFDVDGVFTDGSVYVNENGNEMLKFSRIDGKGIELLKENSFIIAVISSEKSSIIEKRMLKLGINELYLGVIEKDEIYEELKNKHSLRDINICFCGDDIQDLELIKKAGFSCCPKNAQRSIKSTVDYESNLSGGKGFVREICNLLVNGKVRNNE